MRVVRMAAAGMVAMVGVGALVAPSARAELLCNAQTVDAALQPLKAKAIKTCLAPGSLPSTVGDMSIVVHAAYDAKGNVVSAALQSNPSNAREAAACLVSQVRTWTPPCGPGAVDVSFDYTHCDPQVAAEVVKAGKQQIANECLDPTKAPASIVPAGATVSFTVQTRYDATGQVSTSVPSNLSGPYAEQLATCAAARARSWNLKCGPGTLDVPFQFKR